MASKQGALPTSDIRRRRRSSCRSARRSQAQACGANIGSVGRFARDFTLRLVGTWVACRFWFFAVARRVRSTACLERPLGNLRGDHALLALAEDKSARQILEPAFHSATLAGALCGLAPHLRFIPSRNPTITKPFGEAAAKADEQSKPDNAIQVSR